MNKSLALLVVFLSVGLGSGFARKTRNSATLPRPCPNKHSVDEEQRFNEYVLRTYGGDQFEGCLEIRRSDRLVFSERADGRFIIGNDINKGSDDDGVKHPPKIPLGTDITGLGKPNFILGVWTGGAHCCFEFHVLELGEKVRRVAKIDAEDSDYAHFEDIDHDGRYEFIGWDYAFAYWHAGFGQSPAPKVILRFNGTRYVLDLQSMHGESAAPSTLADVASQVRHGEWFQDYPPPLLWESMLDLIYSGHADNAWRLVDDSWTGGHVSKQKFLAGFCGQLATSQYFSELRPLLSDAPCKFDPKLGQRM